MYLRESRCCQQGSGGQPEEPDFSKRLAGHLLELEDSEYGGQGETHHNRLHQDETRLGQNSVV